MKTVKIETKLPPNVALILFVFLCTGLLCLAMFMIAFGRDEGAPPLFLALAVLLAAIDIVAAVCATVLRDRAVAGNIGQLRAIASIVLMSAGLILVTALMGRWYSAIP